MCGFSFSGSLPRGERSWAGGGARLATRMRCVAAEALVSGVVMCVDVGAGALCATGLAL